MPVKVTPQQFAEKWARRLQGATQDIERGVNGVTEAPTQKAAQKVDKMRAGILAALDSGKWEDGLNRVTLQDWKTNMIQKGIPRISQGVQGAQPKVARFAGELIQHIEAGQAAIDKLPDLTLEDSINRVSVFIRHMSTFRRQG